mgnify:CR=1 FL=1
MEHSVLALAILAFGLLLFTVGTHPSHSTDPTDEDSNAGSFLKRSGRSPGQAWYEKNKPG